MENVRDSDAQIRARVLAGLEEDDRTADAAIEVISQQGVITLKGHVASREVRRAAEEIAAARSGAAVVVNDLAAPAPEEDEESLVDEPEAPDVAAFESRFATIPDLDKDQEQK